MDLYLFHMLDESMTSETMKAAPRPRTEAALIVLKI